MKRIIQLTLPWPHRALSPNARVNLMQKARIFKREKYATMMLTKAALQKVGIEKVTVKGGLPDKKWRSSQYRAHLHPACHSLSRRGQSPRKLQGHS